MDPEPQYPVDVVTTEAMKTSKPVGMDMSLDDIVKQRRNANKKRGDGKLSKGGILKVKAGVNKGGPGRSMSGTFGGRGSGPMIQKLYVHVRHTADWVYFEFYRMFYRIYDFLLISAAAAQFSG